MTKTISYPSPLKLSDVKEGQRFFRPYFWSGEHFNPHCTWRIDGGKDGVEYRKCEWLDNIFKSNLCFDTWEKAVQFIEAVTGEKIL